MLNNQVKSFVRPFQAINASNPHFYHIKNTQRMYALNTFLNINKELYCFNTHNIDYTKPLAYIAHHIYQSEETYINRKVNLFRDDTGTKRDEISMDHIHSLHNDVENIYPVTKYATNIKNFLQQYGHKF